MNPSITLEFILDNLDKNWEWGSGVYLCILVLHSILLSLIPILIGGGDYGISMNPNLTPLLYKNITQKNGNLVKWYFQ